MKPAANREAVHHIQAAHGYSERRACRVIQFNRSSARRPPSEDRDLLLRTRMLELANDRRPELSAHDVSDYVRIAVELANDNVRLVHLRTTLRDRMRTSSLMDVAGFTCQLENSLIDLYRHFSRKKCI